MVCRRSRETLNSKRFRVPTSTGCFGSRGLSLVVSDMQQRPTRFTFFGVYRTEASARSQIMGICKV